MSPIRWPAKGRFFFLPDHLDTVLFYTLASRCAFPIQRPVSCPVFGFERSFQSPLAFDLGSMFEGKEQLFKSIHLME